MKLSTPKYTFCLFFQMVFLLCDLIFNCVSLFPRSRDGLIVLFIFQDLFLVLSLSMMMIMLFSTYLFQAGLVDVLVRRYRLSVCVSVLYLVVCGVSQAVWASGSNGGVWLPCVLCAAHYTLSKQSALSMADPRLTHGSI